MKPRTRLARVVLAGDTAALVCFGVFVGLVASGRKGGDTFFSNPWLAWPILIAAAAAIAAGMIAMFCVVTRRDRSLPVVVAGVIGTLVLAWVVLEVTMPH